MTYVWCHVCILVKIVLNLVKTIYFVILRPNFIKIEDPKVRIEQLKRPILQIFMHKFDVKLEKVKSTHI